MGSGVLVKIPARSAADLEVLGENSVSINFAIADIRGVIDVVLGGTLQLNYIIQTVSCGGLCETPLFWFCDVL